ncbi:MAG TPA: hypothetical protein PKA64_08080 [Myxococcota bacterium]|nr:hypothetical protein [Myxococcota bacterium]
MRARWLAPVLLLACSGPDDKGTDGPDYDSDTDTLPESTCAQRAGVEITLPQGTVTGDVAVTVSLRDMDSETASLDLQWSTDGIVQHPLTVAEPRADLASSPEGELYTFTWDTETDLGRELVSGLTLQAVARSATCNPWPLGEVRDVTVDNTSIPEPVCSITLTPAEDPIEGVARVDLTLAHPASTLASVELTWSTDGAAWSPAHLQVVDCDGDAITDGTSGLITSPEGVSHCLQWDSQTDLGEDTTATLRAACFVQGVEQDAATREVTLVNDPVPGPGDLAIVEIMPRPRQSKGHYIELVSTSGHVLDVQGLRVDRWDSVNDLANPPDATFSVDDPSGVLAVDPGARLLLAGSDDPVSSGCLAPDAVWPSTFLLQDDSTITLSVADQPIGGLVFTVDAGWSFRAGIAQGYDPALDPRHYQDAGTWCTQTSALPGCTELASPTGSGTPGAPNDTCPAP